MKDISVVVCSYNRREKLRRLVEGLLEHNLAQSFDWEVVVVDNASNDGTREDFQTLMVKYPEKVNYVFEGKKGKANALNTGVAASRGQILAFTDSDVRVAPDWIESILRHMDGGLEIDALGGRVSLFDPNDPPVTVRLSMVAADVNLKTFSTTDMPIIGCNYAIRRDVVGKVGSFDCKLGPGGITGSGDDLDFVYRICRHGLRVRYVPDVLVYHDHGRKLESDIEEKLRAYAIGRGAFYWKYGIKLDGVVLKWLYWDITSQCRRGFLHLTRMKSFSREPQALLYIGRLLIGAYLYATG